MAVFDHFCNFVNIFNIFTSNSKFRSLTRKLNADASVVISASHNTFEFNGVKYFSNKGMKIPDEIEEEIEEIMDSGKLEELTAVSDKIGIAENREDASFIWENFFDEETGKNYLAQLAQQCLQPQTLKTTVKLF